MTNHPKYPPEQFFPPKYHQGRHSFNQYRVHIKLTYINEPYSNPPDEPEWDDGYHNHYIDVKVWGGLHHAKYEALLMAYKRYPIHHRLEYKAWKCELLKRYCGTRQIIRHY